MAALPMPLLYWLLSLTGFGYLQQPLQQTFLWKKSRLAVTLVRASAMTGKYAFQPSSTLLPAVQSCCPNSQETGSRYDRC